MSTQFSALFPRALSAASRSYNMPTIEDETQEVISACLEDLKELRTQISDLAMFSPNDILEDIPTRDLVYLSLPYVLSEVLGRVKTVDPAVRLPLLVDRERYMRSFVELLDSYDIVPQEDKEVFNPKSVNFSNPQKRREVKVNQYKKEKELRNWIEALHKRLRGTEVEPSNDFELIASLLPKPSQSTETSQGELDSELDERLRETILLLLRLLYSNATSQLNLMEEELQLLKSAPPPSKPMTSVDDSRTKQKEADVEMWRLDKPSLSNGPLLDEKGKPLRPFTILPSGTKNRQEYAASVFGPDHRLPTMTIDEYLQIEQERGNVITGGGPASENVPTSSEQLALDSEMDGTIGGEEKAEQKRQKEEKWAQFTDVNPKGAGNRMNRG